MSAILDRSTRVIDLQQSRRIEVEREPLLGRMVSYVARDLISFDPDPESRWHVIGRGDSPQDATLDLLDQLAEAEVRRRPHIERLPIPELHLRRRAARSAD